MLKRKYFCIVVIGLLILVNSSVRSQTFGFGCLGFFGGYGGIVYQSYKAEGLNQFVKYFNEMKSSTLATLYKTIMVQLGTVLELTSSEHIGRADLFLLQKVIINHYPEQGKLPKLYLMEI